MAALIVVFIVCALCANYHRATRNKYKEVREKHLYSFHYDGYYRAMHIQRNAHRFSPEMMTLSYHELSEAERKYCEMVTQADLSRHVSICIGFAIVASLVLGSCAGIMTG